MTKHLKYSFIVAIILCLITSSHAQELRSKGLEVENEKPDTAMGRKYALIIGISKYEDNGLWALNYGHKDADNFRKFIGKNYLGKFDDVKFLLEENANFEQISRSVWDWLMELRKKKPGKNDALYIYYSGHGFVSRQGQNFLPIDCIISDGNNSAIQNNIALPTIRIQVEPLLSAGMNVFYIIDACRTNDSTTKGKFISPAQVSELIIEPNEYFFYAAAKGKPSYEDHQLEGGNGIFTFFFLLGLQGAADTDDDNKVSLMEIEDFLDYNIKNYTKSKKANRQEFTSAKPDGYDKSKTMSYLPKDTVLKYQKIYQLLQKKLEQKAFRKGFMGHDDKFEFLVSKGFPLEGSSKKSVHSTKQVEKPVDDTITNQVYLKFKKAVDDKNLIEPAGQSAYDYFLQIKKEEGENDLSYKAQKELFAALESKTQKLITRYLRGSLVKRSKQDFDLAYKEIITAESLLEKDNAYQQVLQPKKYFLKARGLAGSANPRDWDQGLKVIDSALATDPLAPYSHYTKAILFSSKHRYSSAVKNFKKAIELAPGWTFALHRMAEALYYLSETDKSISISREVLKKDSLYSDAYVLLARNFEKIKLYDSAAHYDKLALSIDPSNTNASNHLGTIYLLSQDFGAENSKLALKQFSAGAFQYRDALSFTHLGDRYSDLKIPDTAAFYYQSALNLDPYSLETIERYAIHLFRQGRLNAADSLYKVAFERMGNDSRVYESLVDLKFRQGMLYSADSLFNRLISMNQEDPSIFIHYSKLLESNGQVEKAKEVLHQGLKFIPNSPSLIYNLAEFFFKNQSRQTYSIHALDSSKYYFNLARVITPEHSFTHFGLYQVFLSKGNTDSAFASLQLARLNNRYIENLTNFNPDFILLGDKALGERNYQVALKFYVLARSKSNDFEKNRKLGLAYYLMNELEKAKQYADSLADFRMTASQKKLQKQLLAHIFFAQKNYQSALEIFQELDGTNPLPGYVEQAACYWMMNNKEKSRELILSGRKNDVNAINNFIEMEGIRYHTVFTNVVKQLKLF